MITFGWLLICLCVGVLLLQFVEWSVLVMTIVGIIWVIYKLVAPKDPQKADGKSVINNAKSVPQYNPYAKRRAVNRTIGDAMFAVFFIFYMFKVAFETNRAYYNIVAGAIAAAVVAWICFLIHKYKSISQNKNENEYDMPEDYGFVGEYKTLDKKEKLEFAKKYIVDPAHKGIKMLRYFTNVAGIAIVLLFFAMLESFSSDSDMMIFKCLMIWLAVAVIARIVLLIRKIRSSKAHKAREEEDNLSSTMTDYGSYDADQSRYQYGNAYQYNMAYEYDKVYQSDSAYNYGMTNDSKNTVKQSKEMDIISTVVLAIGALLLASPFILLMLSIVFKAF